MPKYSTFDQYITDAEPFAQEILKFLRTTVHAAAPQVEETFKWNFPNFLYKGKILCHMSGFKQHVAFGFWLSGHMSDPHQLFQKGDNSGMGSFGKITKIEDLPSREILIEYLHEAIALTDSGKTIARNPAKAAKTLETPEYFHALLQQNPKALNHFQDFSQSRRNEYIEWITEAKTEPTRQKRMAQALEWLSEGKGRNWKYER